MLLQYGNTLVGDDWAVKEQYPIGYARVYYVHGGDVTYTDQNINIKLKKNYVYILPTTIPYELQQNINDKFCCTFVHIDFISKFVPQLVELEVTSDTLLHSILNSIKYAIVFNNDEIITSVAESLEKYLSYSGLLSSHPQEIILAVEYIRNNYTRKFTLTELSSYIGYNEQYFIRFFKKHMKESPYQYLMEMRLKESIRLLKLNIPIKQIARETGYLDTKTFCRSFKNRYGVSPGNYKKYLVPVP